MTIQYAPPGQNEGVSAARPDTVHKPAVGDTQNFRTEGTELVVVPPAQLTRSGRHRVPRPQRLRMALARHRAYLREYQEAGMATAEYAIAMIAAAGFAGLLIVVLKSDPVREMLASIVQTALGTR